MKRMKGMKLKLQRIFLLAGGRAIISVDKEHSKLENRYYALGRTDMNRLLFAVFAVQNQKISIISARDMTDSEMERYIK